MPFLLLANLQLYSESSKEQSIVCVVNHISKTYIFIHCEMQWWPKFLFVIQEYANDTKFLDLIYFNLQDVLEWGQGPVLSLAV